MDGQAADVAHRALTASLELRATRDVSVSVGAGATLGGSLALGARRFTLDPGFASSIATSMRILDGAGSLPFLFAGLAASASGERSREDRVGTSATYVSTDLRLSATAGKVFWNALGPYVTARAFGGPVFWKLDGRSVTGTDVYHVQLGLGVVAAVKGLDVIAELVPLGEKAVTVGAGYAF
jgi:hypothetical protein